MDDLKLSVVKMLKAGQPVSFGCDVGQFSGREAEIMDMDLHKAALENAFDISLGMTKAERLQMNESSMTHVMVVTGVHIDLAMGHATRFRVENSWGPDPGEKGDFVMTDKWIDEFVYQVVGTCTKSAREGLSFRLGTRRTPWRDPISALFVEVVI